MVRILLYVIAAIILIPVLLIREKLYEVKNRNDIDGKKRKKVLFMLRSVIAVILLSAGYLFYRSEYEKTEITREENSPYTLIIWQVGTPGFPFGNSDCRLTLQKDKKTVNEMDIVLKNDGKWPDADNFSVQWNPDSVSVTATAEEQEDVTYVLQYDKDKLTALDQPQVLHANFISWNKDSFYAVVCDPMENTVFPNGAKLEVKFDENTYFIDLDGSVTSYHAKKILFEPSIGKKFRWSEGMVLEIEITACQEYAEGNGYHNLALGRRIENVDVIAIDVIE